MKKIRGFGGRTAGLVGWILIVCALTSCSLATDGASSAPASQATRPETSSVEQVSQTSEIDVLSEIRDISPEERELFLKIGDLYGKACTAREKDEGKLYLEGDHVKIYQAEIDYLSLALSDTGHVTAESEQRAVNQMKIEVAFLWAAEQEGFSLSEQELARLGETSIESYTNPEDPFYPGNRVMLEGSGLSEEEYFNCLRERTKKTYLVNQYADSKFSQWYDTWEQTEATQVESWTDGINSTVNAAWAEEQLRMAEEILAADHAELC